MTKDTDHLVAQAIVLCCGHLFREATNRSGIDIRKHGPKVGDGACTDLNSLCYNSFTEHGQMLGVADACEGFWAGWLTVQFTVHLAPKSGSIRWNGWKQAKRWTVRMDSKHAGLALTA